MAEVTNEGVIIDTLDGVLAEINAVFLAEFGAGINGIDTSPQSYTGRQNPIIASRIVSTQQLLAEITTAINPNNAQGRLLDFIGSLFREPRLPATSATIPARLYGVPGFLVGDRRVRYRRNGTIWRVPLGVTVLASGTVDVDLVSDAPGTTLPDGTLIEAFQDGSDQWTIVDTAPASFFAVESTGAYSAGTVTETDPPYRVRIGLAGLSSGTGTEDGIRRAIARVAGIDAVVDNNREIFVNANGVPGKHTEVIFDQGTVTAVAQAIYDSFSDTNLWFGTETAIAYQRDPFTGELDLASPVVVQLTPAERILVAWDVTINSAGAEVGLPDDVVSLVQSVLVAYSNVTLKIGLDVQPGEAAAAIREALPVGSIVDGNLTVLVGLVGGPPPAAVPIAITSRQRARTDSAAQAAEVLASNVETYNIFAGDVLSLAVNGGTAQAVTMLVTDFQVISAATALEIATIINTRMSGFVAGVEGGALVIRSGTTGATSSVNVLPLSSIALLGALGLAIGLTFGNDGYTTVTVI
jgi:hypothetical protein